MSHHLALANEFPEHKDRIIELKSSDAHFRKLMDKYDNICEDIYRAEQRLDALSEEAEEAMRRDRLKIKDELYSFLTKPKS